MCYHSTAANNGVRYRAPRRPWPLPLHSPESLHCSNQQIWERGQHHNQHTKKAFDYRYHKTFGSAVTGGYRSLFLGEGTRREDFYRLRQLQILENNFRMKSQEDWNVYLVIGNLWALSPELNLIKGGGLFRIQQLETGTKKRSRK